MYYFYVFVYVTVLKDSGTILLRYTKIQIPLVGNNFSLERDERRALRLDNL